MNKVVVDPPPQLRPDEKLSKDQMAELALWLLNRLATDDPVLAERMRRLGLKPTAAQVFGGG